MTAMHLKKKDWATGQTVEVRGSTHDCDAVHAADDDFVMLVDDVDNVCAVLPAQVDSVRNLLLLPT